MREIYTSHVSYRVSTQKNMFAHIYIHIIYSHYYILLFTNKKENKSILKIDEEFKITFLQRRYKSCSTVTNSWENANQNQFTPSGWLK